MLSENEYVTKYSIFKKHNYKKKYKKIIVYIV